jgi:hypothetical protein
MHAGSAFRAIPYCSTKSPPNPALGTSQTAGTERRYASTGRGRPEGRRGADPCRICMAAQLRRPPVHNRRAVTLYALVHPVQPKVATPRAPLPRQC